MRSLILATTIAALSATPAAAAPQAIGGHQRMTPRPPMTRPMPPRPGGHWTAPRPGMRHGMRWGSRWGGRVNGRWHAGVFAPGGWAAYRQPFVGWVLPSYWYAPSYYIDDYAAYGLAAPQHGYTWTRYYDDAVLVDHGGRVYDRVGDVDWDRYDDDRDDRDDGRDDRRDDGVGGAVIGGIVGGVAGNAIAGRGNRAAGTIVGAGVGAIAGAAIDRAEDRHRRRHDDDRLPPIAPDDHDGPDRGAPYPAPGYRDGGYPPMREHRVVIDGRDAHRHGHDATRPYTTVVRGPGTVTTVTVIPAVTTTTTTTEYVYASAPRHGVKRAWKAKPRGKLCKCR